MSDFTHLHVHSHYSLLAALPKIPELVKKAKEYGMNALALSDNGNLYGAIEFYKECVKQDIKPIIGVDFYLAARTRHDKQGGIDNRRNRLILLAENEHGYTNLIKLVSRSHLEGFYYKPRIDKELLEQFHDGLIAIVPAFGNPLAAPLRASNAAEAEKEFAFFETTFGKENIFFEITKHDEIEGHAGVMRSVSQFAHERGIGVVASNDVHYLEPGDAQARRTLVAIQSHPEPGSRSLIDSEADFSFTSPERMEELFRDMPEALTNTAKIAERCNLTLTLGKALFPHFEIPAGTTHADELTRLAYEGLARRGIPETDEVKARLGYELSVIIGKGYAPYFLVMADLIQYAHEQGIFTNTRGSAAGSLVSYATDITTVNPLEYGLPFERFLNPERPSLPDIDLDIADDRRDELIGYIRRKYGEDKVAQIGTFGTMAARGVVRDVARALGYEYGVGDRIAKLIPFGSQGFPMTIDRALKENPDLKKLYESDEDAQKVIDMGKKIEGGARHISVHAAGVVISPVPLDEVVPVQLDPKGEGKIITQYDMHSATEEYGGAGLIKLDLLGLKNLSVLADALRRIKKVYGEEINLDTLPLGDKKTYAMLAAGETEAVFQLSGEGMTRYIKELRPTNIHDINAMVALYRPGPMLFIPQYIERKHEPSRVVYMDTALEPILKKTFGVLTYQDDILMIANKIAGYTMAEADKLRKAMGKKIPAEMAAQKEKFIKGCVEHSGWGEKKARELWTWIEPFAAYGFNKAHAVSYGRLAFQTAYLKAHYPAAYMAAVLTADAGNLDEVAKIINECKRMGVDVLPPDVNESFSDFSVVTGAGADSLRAATGHVAESDIRRSKRSESAPVQDSIRFGLCSIKNFGEGIADAIIEERKQNGPYTSLENFLGRVKDRNLNKKSLEALIGSGAMDRFGERGLLYTNIPELLAYNKEATTRGADQNSLFGALGSSASAVTLRRAEAATPEQKLAWEKELLGLYISGHPLDKHRDFLAKLDTSIAKVKSAPAGTLVAAYGLLEDFRVVNTKKGERMAILKISDATGSLEAVAFPKIFSQFQSFLILSHVIGVKGRLSSRGGEELSLIAEKVKKLDT